MAPQGSHEHKIGQRDSDKCTHCNAEIEGEDYIENFLHLITECPATEASVQSSFKDYPNVKLQSLPINEVLSFISILGMLDY